MTTEEYLGQIYRFSVMITDKLEEIENLRCIATSITSKQKEISVQSSHDQDKMGSAVAKIVDAQAEIAGLVDLYIFKRKEIIKKIDAMPNTESYEILHDRYVKCLSYKDIEEKQNLCYRSLNNKKKTAITEFEGMYGTEYLDYDSAF